MTVCCNRGEYPTNKPASLFGVAEFVENCGRNLLQRLLVIGVPIRQTERTSCTRYEEVKSISNIPDNSINLPERTISWAL